MGMPHFIPDVLHVFPALYVFFVFSHFPGVDFPPKAYLPGPHGQQHRSEQQVEEQQEAEALQRLAELPRETERTDAGRFWPPSDPPAQS